MRTLVLALLLVGCSPEEQAAPSTEAAQRARDAFGRALAQADRGAALAALENLRRAQPDKPDAVVEYASLLARAGETAQAVWVLESAVLRFPESDTLKLALGAAALITADPSRAGAVAAAIEPGSEQYVHALALRGRAKLMLGDLDAALAIFQQAEALDPSLLALRVPRIRALLQERRFEEAQQALETAGGTLAPDADDTVLRRLQAALYRSQAAAGEPDLAIAGLRGMVEERPDDWQAWGALVDVLWRGGRPAEARDLVAEAVAADPAKTVLLGTLASLQAALGDADVAEETLRTLFERSKSPAAALALARVHTSNGEVDAALAVYQQSLDAFPEAAVLRQARAETLIDAGRLPEARTEIEALGALTVPPALVEFLNARIQLAEGHPGAAASQLRELVTRLDTTETQYWLGRALEEQGDLAGAERRYGVARGRGPYELAPLFGILRVAQLRGDWRAVAASGRQLVLRAPGRTEGWQALIPALLQLGEIDAADEISVRYAELLPERSEPHWLRALVLRERGRVDDALASWERAHQLGGDAATLAAQRALIVGQRDPAAGVAAARAAVVTHPDSALAHAALAGQLFGIGQAEEGAVETDRALALDPEDPRPLRTRAEFHAATGRFAAARRDAEAYLAKRPQDAHVHFVLGAALDGLGKSEEAVAAYRRAAALDERAFAPRNNLAELLAASGDLDGALAAAQEAYALAEDNAYVMDTLGMLYLRKGLVDRSVAILERAHASAPELPEAQLHLALAYGEAGRKPEARVLLDDLRSRSDPDDRSDQTDLRQQIDEAMASL